MFHKYSEFCRYATFNRKPFFQIAKDYISESSRVLDIGAGDGAFADFINHENIYLLDGNEVSIEKLKSRYQNVELFKIPGTIPFDNQFFDVIHCSHLIEHLRYKDAYTLLKEVDRLLKPGGVFVLSAPLLHAGFYNDFSHIKPYNSAVLIKYLTGGKQDSTTGKLISGSFVKEKMVYRYTFTQSKVVYAFRSKKNVFNVFAFYLNLLMKKLQFGKFERSGYTIVLRKEK